ncbi:MAG: hypothetical protein WCI27_05725 [Candidatus Omnitrophota bacterium]
MKRILIFLVGVIAALSLLEIGLRLASFIYQESRKISFQVTTKTDMKKFVVLCLGNSYTLGMGVSPEMSYPSQLHRMLDQKGINNLVINKGVACQNTSQLLSELRGYIRKYHPDLIILQTGNVNPWNYSRYIDYLSREKKRSSAVIYFKNVLANLMYESRVYRLLILLNDRKGENMDAQFSRQGQVESVAFVSPSEAEIDQWIKSDMREIVKVIQEENIGLIVQNYPRSTHVNLILLDIANELRLPFVDNYSVFQKKMLQGAAEQDLFVPDGHCSAAGYGVMAENVFKKIVATDSTVHEPSLPLFVMHEQEISLINDVIYTGWKDGAATEMLVKYKDDLVRIKESFLEDLTNNKVETPASREYLAVNKAVLKKSALLLLVEAEQAVFHSNNTLFELNILTCMDVCHFFADQESWVEVSVENEFLIFDAIFTLLERHGHQQSYDKVFFKKCILKLQQLMDHSRYGKVFYDEHVKELKLRIDNVGKRARSGESMADISESYGGGIPVSLWERLRRDESAKKLFHERAWLVIDRWSADAKEAFGKNASAAFDRHFEIITQQLEERLIAGSYENSRDALVDTFICWLRKGLPKTQGAADRFYYFLSQVKLVYIGMLGKLFEIDHHRSLASLSELELQYAVTLPKDDFTAEGKDFSLYQKVDERRVCGVGVDRKIDQGMELLDVGNSLKRRFSDQGGELLDVGNFLKQRSGGDICFLF